MDNLIKLPKQLVMDACQGGIGVLNGDWRVVLNEMIDTWRWGTIHRVVLCSEHGPDWFAFDYQLSSGDGNWNTFDDEGDEVELYRVRPRNVTVVEYVKVEDKST